MNYSKDKTKIADLINYQSGSVVSKEIIKGKNGGATVFAFDKGEGLSEHTAPFDALVIILDGAAEIIIAEKSHILSSGEMIIMPADVPHALRAVERFKMLLMMIK